MKVIIYDYKAQDEVSWAKVVKALAQQTGVEVVAFGTDTPRVDVVQANGDLSNAIAFVHSDQWRQWDIAQEREEQPLGAFVVHVGTNGFSSTFKPFSNRRHASRFTAKQFRDTGRGLAFLKSVALDRPDWRLLNPPPTCEIGALTILCEAWLATQPGMKTAPLGITSPKGPAIWFMPFGVAPTRQNVTKCGKLFSHAESVRVSIEKLLVEVIDGVLTEKSVVDLRDALAAASRQTGMVSNV